MLNKAELQKLQNSPLQLGCACTARVNCFVGLGGMKKVGLLIGSPASEPVLLPHVAAV